MRIVTEKATYVIKLALRYAVITREIEGKKTTVSYPTAGEISLDDLEKIPDRFWQPVSC